MIPLIREGLGLSDFQLGLVGTIFTVKVFHDEAADALIETLQVCHAAGFDGPLRCDHVPTLAGENNDTPGYGTLGRLFANGCILGLMDALRIPRE